MITNWGKSELYGKNTSYFSLPNHLLYDDATRLGLERVGRGGGEGVNTL